MKRWSTSALLLLTVVVFLKVVNSDIQRNSLLTQTSLSWKKPEYALGPVPRRHADR